MGFWEKLRAFFGGQPAGSGEKPRAPRTQPTDPDALWLYFRCSRCGSIVRVRAHKRNDLNRVEEEGFPGVFELHKDVMDNKCFQLMHADIYFDASYQIVSADVQGGQLVSQEEYEAAQQSTATPSGA